MMIDILLQEKWKKFIQFRALDPKKNARQQGLGGKGE